MKVGISVRVIESQILTDPSPQPVAMSMPSGLKAIHKISLFMDSGTFLLDPFDINPDDKILSSLMLALPSIGLLLIISIVDFLNILSVTFPIVLRSLGDTLISLK